METSELKEILDQHRLWLETNGVQGELANLEGADLRGADLTGANLRSAELRRADLTGAYLTGAYLTNANLTNAYLTDAYLTGAYLNGAYLMGADLRGAYLHGAYLHGAYLHGANLGGANLGGANLRGANLTGAVGLPNVSWIIPGCLVQLNHIKYEFYLEKEGKWESFVQDSFGFIIQNNPEEGTFDILVEDRIIRGIPDWVKYSGLKKLVEERKLC